MMLLLLGFSAAETGETSGMKPNFLAGNSKTKTGQTEYVLFLQCQVSPGNKRMALFFKTYCYFPVEMGLFL